MYHKGGHINDGRGLTSDVIISLLWSCIKYLCINGPICNECVVRNEVNLV